MESRTFSTEIGGKTLTAEFTDLANQAHGSVLLRLGNSAVLATAVMSEYVREGLEYFPLTVDYEERFYAAGQILGSRFIRREGRPTDDAILSGRVVDRTIRPLFNQNIRNEVQVVVTVLSIDEDDPDILGVISASLSLVTSDIPWGGPVSGVRIGKMRGGEAFIVNPTYKERESGEFLYEVLVCGKGDTINMIEVGAKEVSEAELSQALAKGLEEIARIENFQNEIAATIGKEKRQVAVFSFPETLDALFAKHIESKLQAAVFSAQLGKHALSNLKKEWFVAVAAELQGVSPGTAGEFFERHVDRALHTGVLEKKIRADGRGLTQLRPLFAKAGGISPIIHGSGIFYRGGTHVFSALTLGGPGDSQLIDSMEQREVHKRFMHHYNFPPFSSGETGRIGSTNRRMVGHGALAEKALEPVIPPKETFPYTVRLVSECLASNGSTSMGSVCASSLALMDGGVPITRPVAGIAMGLVMSLDYARNKEYEILTDIQGPEDHHGDMDCKVAGTREGVTAIQLDVKVQGVPLSILTEALEGARKARLAILDLIEKEIPSPRSSLSPYAPKILTLIIKKDQIGSIIGPGGKTINGIKELTGVEEIQIEEDGTVFITGKMDSAEAARSIIENMTREYKAGERFEGEVSRITNFGAFVKLNGTAEGLVHVSEIAPFRVENVSSALSIGERVPVIIKEIDALGRINLSIKGADPDYLKKKGGGNERV